MLRGIRNASATWLGRLVMGAVMSLLAAIFAIWGINDIFRGFGRSALAKIGGTEIQIEQFRRTYNDRLQLIGRQLGRPLTQEQANAFGLDRQVLAEMVAEAGLDQRARQMRLGVSDDEVVSRITSDKVFQTPNGKFDRARFEQVLRSAGYTEQRFVAEQRRMMLRRQIIDTIAGDLVVPKAWLAAINQYQNEQRNIEYLALGPAQAGDIPQPTAEELGKYFEARKAMFRAPEYRKIVTVQATPESLAKWMEISEADVKAAFEQNRSHYVTPERRHVEQIVFPNMQDAEAAAARLKDGTSFAALAAERGLKDKDIDLGTVTKADLVDPAVADAAFALKEGEVSAPIQGRFGAVIVTVLKIDPEETKSLADVAPQVRTDLAMERAKAEVQRIHNEIEDARAGGSTLEEAAQKAKLPIVTYGEVDRSGRDAQGKPIANLPHAAEVINAAFASDVGVDNDPIEADGGYIWYDVAGITPARDRTLDEVKAQVEEHWRADEIASRLKTKAADLADKLKSGTSFDELAKANDLKVETAEKLTREKAAGAISPRMLPAIFHTAKDGFGSVAGDRPDNWIVFRVSDVTVPKLDPNSADAKRIADTVERQMSNDLSAEYMAWLENDLGTSVNQQALVQALGGGAPDTN
jgi:peptidyl-prolyl cis-trans isomerase D